MSLSSHPSIMMTRTAAGEERRKKKKNCPFDHSTSVWKSLSLSPGVFYNYGKQKSTNLQLVTPPDRQCSLFFHASAWRKEKSREVNENENPVTEQYLCLWGQIKLFFKQLKKDDVAEVAEDDVFHRECCMAGCFGVHVSQWPSSNSLLGFCNTFFIEIVF